MFIASHSQEGRAPAERNVVWAYNLHSAPDGAGYPKKEPVL